MFLDKLKNKFKKNKNTTFVNSTDKNTIEEEQIRNIEIEITKEDNFIIFDIKEDCNLKEYIVSREKYGLETIDKDIANGVLFDKNLELIKKKKIYIYKDSRYKYNIYSNDNKIVINERINTLDLENGFIDERIITIDKTTGNYKISRLKHNEIRSTFYMKFFSSDNPEEPFFHLEKKEALEMAKEILKNLSVIPNIKRIVDFEKIIELLCLDINFDKDIDIKIKEEKNGIKKELKNNLYF